MLGKIYIDKSKVAGIESDVKDFKQKIFDQYIDAVKKDACTIPAGKSKDQARCINFFGMETMAPGVCNENTDAVEIQRLISEILNAGDQFVLVSSSLMESPPETAQVVKNDLLSERKKTTVVAKNISGIDLNPANSFFSQIKRDGRGAPLPWPQQNLENIKINGFYPVIMNIMPINAKTLSILRPAKSKI